MGSLRSELIPDLMRRPLKMDSRKSTGQPPHPSPHESESSDRAESPDSFLQVSDPGDQPTFPELQLSFIPVYPALQDEDSRSLERLNYQLQLVNDTLQEAVDAYKKRCIELIEEFANRRP